MKSTAVAPRRLKTSPPGATAAKGPRAPRDRRISWWRRWIVDPVVAQLTQGITPEKISLSLAVGSLCAFFPILGAATPLCLVAGGTLRLNQAIIQIVNGATAPLYPLMVLGLIRLGDCFLGATNPDLDPRSMAALLQSDPAQFLHRFGPIAGHAVLGWAILAPFWAVGGYFCLVRMLRPIAALPRLAAGCRP